MKKIKKLLARLMIILLSALAFIAICSYLYLQRPLFGASAEGERLARMIASPNYKDGVFVNRSHTPSLTEGHSMSKVLYDFAFGKSKRTKPYNNIPSVETDLKNLPTGDWLVWFGHSSYFIQTDGIKLLIDPVFSGNASPIPGTTKAFKGTEAYSTEDMPAIDYLVITHDHYDHLDYETVTKLRSKVKKIICGLGVGAHLEKWGYQSENIIELDWDTEAELQPGVKIYGLTARHFSGRSFKRDQTLWLSFLLQTLTLKVYIGGDSGYDTHFKAIGERHGPIDLAILENGQYNEAWKAIHFLPGENLQAAVDLKAKRLMPVHSAKFSLALHDWDEPLKEMSRKNKHTKVPLVTPKIGELVDLNNSSQTFTEWWTKVDVR